MCGIVGYINLDSKIIEDSATINRMLQIQKHRGPDDSGIRAISLLSGRSEEITCGNPVKLNQDYEGILGFNRLSILDLSKNGHQPMLSPDENVILLLNGELYNAFDYKDELEEWGYKFKSTSDTEIALALFLKYGFEGMLSRLNGMFAIVVADLKAKLLYIVRDRFGIKPMYYLNTGKTLAFSSELKTFKFLDGFNFELNEKKLDEFMLFRNNVQGTLYKDIESLEPGYFLILNKDRNIQKQRYFNINDYQRAYGKLDLDSYGSFLDSWMNSSVRSQLMSDVKLGCQLSGGIDSSLVTWLANKNSEKGKFESVSIVFKNEVVSEEKYIDIVAKKLDIVAHKFELDARYYLDHFENATWHFEAPINHPNTIGIYKLSQCAKEYVTVLLSGEGADEVFGGYSRFGEIAFPFRIKRLLGQLKKNWKSPANLRSYLSEADRAVMATAFMHPYLASKLYPAFDQKAAMKDRLSVYSSLNGSRFDKQVKYEMLTYLPDLLVRQDKMSMAHSIENRVPFLDNQVVENAFTIPEKNLLLRKSPEGYNTEKYLLKKMTAGRFGDEFAFRNKMGFGIPVRDFFRHKDFNDYIKDKLLPGIRNRGLFNRNIVENWVNSIDSINYLELEALWIVLAFEAWTNIYLENGYENWNTSY